MFLVRMINEANEPSSACRLWRVFQVETSTPPLKQHRYHRTDFEIRKISPHVREMERFGVYINDCMEDWTESEWFNAWLRLAREASGG
jgi:hypothetical protein